MMPQHTKLAAPLAVLLLAVATSGTAACGAAGHQADERHSASEKQSASGRVRLDASQLAHIRIEELSTSAAASAIKVTGAVEFNGDRMAKLLPPVSGQVSNLTVNVGDTVHKNDVLFIVSSREAAAAIAEHQSSHKDLELAEKTLAMTRDLYQHQAASRMALEQSESEAAKARSKVLQAEETLQVLGLDPHADDDTRIRPRLPVRTPIDGTIIERTVTNGQFVGPENPPLVTIADLSSVWVQGDIFERDLRHIFIGQKADVTAAAYPADRFRAQVSRIASVVDPQTRTAKVRFLVANPASRLKPGMFASISLYLADDGEALTMPAKAVFVENGRTFAYVQTAPEEFARRDVETAAAASADRVRVVRGVQAGDHVVSDGVLLLRQLEADAAPQ